MLGLRAPIRRSTVPPGAYRSFHGRQLFDVLHIIAEEKDLALKGGAAIDLSARNLPRLSVDLDLTSLRVDGRNAAFAGMAAGSSCYENFLQTFW